MGEACSVRRVVGTRVSQGRLLSLAQPTYSSALSGLLKKTCMSLFFPFPRSRTKSFTQQPQSYTLTCRLRGHTVVEPNAMSCQWGCSHPSF